MMFTESFCDRCIHEKWSHTQNDNDKKCDILSRSMVYDTIEEGYPKEWMFNDEGWPVCTAWKKWDWDQDDEGNWNDPVEPEPEDPMQLVFPFFEEWIEQNTEIEIAVEEKKILVY